MSSVFYQYSGCSSLISGPQVFVCNCPMVLAHISPHSPGLPRCNLGRRDSGLGQE
jgi:hypothetical protein